MNDFDPTDWQRLLTPLEREALLGEIASVSLAVGVRLSPEMPPRSEIEAAAGTAAALNSPIERLRQVETLLPVLTQALTAIAQSPLTASTRDSRPVLPQRARQVTATAWMAHARRGSSCPTVEETVTRLSYGIPENRAIKSFLVHLERDSHSIARLAQAEQEYEAAERAVCCADRLHRVLSEPLWQEVEASRSAWKQPPTQRETLRPDYACLARERTRCRKSLRFDWENPLLTLPPRETWRLYEFWCFLTVLHALKELGWNRGTCEQIATVDAGRLAFMPVIGERSRITLASAHGKHLFLTYNQAFDEGRESLSHTMQPDIAISDGARVWILDAKFKPYSEPGEEGGDINQMHAYRDAIVDGVGTRTIVHAWCLYAGLTGAPNRTHITYGRGEEAPVGALCLRPCNMETLKNLKALLEGWTQAAPRPSRES